jgi:hypothetical protein
MRLEEEGSFNLTRPVKLFLSTDEGVIVGHHPRANLESPETGRA